MSKRNNRQGPGRQGSSVGRQDLPKQSGGQANPSYQKPVVDMTPGRAPAEGGDIESPSHERWEERTPERDPAEGPDLE